MTSHLRSTGSTLLAVCAGALLVSCGGGDNGNGTEPPTTGTLRVSVTADGSARSGVTVHRYEPGSGTSAATATTGNDGNATFSGVPEGSWEVEVVPPEDFGLDAGEDARKAISVVAGETAMASFALVDTFTGETVMAGDNLTFSQADLTISAGTTVRWINTGSMLHTVTPDGHSEWTAANLTTNGSTFKHTFATPGTYDYYCDPHRTNGMVGTVTVN